jgi:hypothetical protein
MRAPALERQIHQNRTASHADLDLVWTNVPQPGTGCPGTAWPRLWTTIRPVRRDASTDPMIRENGRPRLRRQLKSSGPAITLWFFLVATFLIPLFWRF